MNGRTNIVVTTAEQDALRAAQVAYEAISSARAELNRIESRGIYQPDYLDEQRQKLHDQVQLTVENSLASGRENVASARLTIERELAKLTAVSPDKLSAAQGRISMFLGDLAEDPRQLLGVYERVFDVAEDRAAVEQLAQYAFRVLSDTQKRQMVEAEWNALQKRLEDRMPVAEQEKRHDLAELERADEYLSNVTAATNHALKMILGEAKDTISYGTSRFLASKYEKEKLFLKEQAMSPIEVNLAYGYKVAS